MATQTGTAGAAAPRLQELDLLRLLAAMMVVAYHYLSHASAVNRVNLAFGAIFDWSEPVARLADLGRLGVDIFFMVSGFVVVLSAENRSVRTFLASRAARILPAFWFCCVLTWVTIKLDPSYRHVSWAQLAANLAFVARPLGYEFVDGVYWSLVIEIRFYLLVALVMWWRGMQAYPAFLALWLALAAADLFGLVPGAMRFLALPQYAPCFVAGGAIYLISQGCHVKLAHLLGLGALVLMCQKALDKTAPLISDINLVIVGVLSFAMALLWAVATRRTAALGRPWMTVAGALTYPLYLLHEDLGFVFMRHFPAREFSWLNQRLGITLCAVVLALLAAYAVVVFVERPLAPGLRRWLAGGVRPMARLAAGGANG